LIPAALLEALPYCEILELGPEKAGVRGISARALIKNENGPVKVFAKLNLRDEECFQREASAVLLLSFVDSSGFNVAKPIVTSENPNLIVWHDLGELGSLGDVLESSDTASAEAALLALADGLASLHASTRSLFGDASRVLVERSGLECSMLREGTEKIAVLIEKLGGERANVFEAIHNVVDLYEDQHRFAALTHGDQAPSNVLVESDEIWLIDFEYASFRPALYDLATWSVLCPLPVEIVSKMAERYRSVVSDWLPEPEFAISWGIVCAFRALSMASWFSPGIADAKGHWGKDWDQRSALITGLGQAAEATKNVEGLESVNRFLRMFYERTNSAWELSPLVWPTFSGLR
jgi:Phosphotransferase enzyme family